MTEVNVLAEAVSAGWHEFRYPRPAIDEPSEAFVRGLNAAAAVLRRQWESEHREQMCAEVRDISNARHVYAQRRVDQMRAWYNQVECDEAYQRHIQRWDEAHPALIALWQRHDAIREESKPEADESANQRAGDDPCPFTQAHTADWCGHAACRRS